MNELLELLQSAGITKVKLAKYLGVSRQMVYNYLELEKIIKWPTEKRILLCKLLNISEENPDEDIHKIKLNSDYLENIEAKLEYNRHSSLNEYDYFNMPNLSKEEKRLVNDLIFIIKEKFTDERTEDTFNQFKYLYNILQSINNNPEIKYIFAYLSKILGFTDANEYKFNENAQFILESILFTAMNLYSSGGATKSKLIAVHEKFEQTIEAKKEEILTRTEQLNTIQVQALRELGYNKLTNENGKEVIKKMAEIEMRKEANR